MTRTEAELENPWAAYGWMLSAMWLVFLVYPLIGVANSDRSLALKLLGTLAIAAFGAVYVWAMTQNYTAEGEPVGLRTSVGWFAVLLALLFASTPVIGLEAIGMTPFLLSFAIFTLPLRRALPVAGVMIMVTMAIPALMGRFSHWAFFLVVLGVVLISTTMTRIAQDKDADYTRARQALALAEERERVARDVHDVLGHSLTLVAVKTEVTEKLLDVDTERARAELAEIRALTRTALAEIRETVGGLRVASLADELQAAGEALQGAGIRAELPTDLSVVDPRHRTVLAWVLREAVTNVVRHSGASRCVVSLGQASLVVDDDGRGLPGSRGGGREGNGVRGLRERVAGVDGRLSIGSGPDGRGTRLEVQL